MGVRLAAVPLEAPGGAVPLRLVRLGDGVPTVWLFQVLFLALGPFVDLRVLHALGSFAYSAITQAAPHQDWQPLPRITHVLAQTGFFYGAFFGVELAAAFVAFRLDGENLTHLSPITYHPSPITHHALRPSISLSSQLVLPSHTTCSRRHQAGAVTTKGRCP